MKISIAQGSVTEVESDALIVNVFDGVESPGGATGAVDAALGGVIAEMIASKEIKGKLMETTLIHAFGRVKPKRVLIVGLGKSGDLDTRAIRQVSGAAVRSLRGKGIRTVTSIVHGAGVGGIDVSLAAQAVIEGTLLGLFKYDLYKSDKDSEPDGIESFTIVERDPAKIPEIESGVSLGTTLAEATNGAREMADHPANVMTPPAMALRAQKIAEQYHLDFCVLDRLEMAEMGMGGIISVSKGSEQPPKLIVMRYIAGPDRPTLALVGKGVTFDSGGISIKPSEGMHLMKFDMCGGTAVIHAMAAIAQMKPGINVLGLVPAVENMPSGTAYRPGDVVTCYSGKTVEITTTDAEGRMILCDAITYAVRQGADYIIDIATLTGGCVVALGHDYTGLMGNDHELMSRLKEAATSAGERVWELPLPPDYMDLLKSQVADMINAGGRYASAIQGGLFLKEFTDDKPWVHMDIAGPADISGSGGPADAGKYVDQGATGVGVRSMAMLAKILGG